MPTLSFRFGVRGASGGRFTESGFGSTLSTLKTVIGSYSVIPLTISYYFLDGSLELYFTLFLGSEDTFFYEECLSNPPCDPCLNGNISDKLLWSLLLGPELSLILSSSFYYSCTFSLLLDNAFAYFSAAKR